ncbi:hypothetical protein C8R44DRAFT_855510 [Mycena epipterygia]|nr:hypothetical protein C8R44DRAFT_855510 [Mycena epipterygia]
MVKAHKPHCIGRNSSATHPRKTPWEPSQEMLKEFYPLDDESIVYHEEDSLAGARDITPVHHPYRQSNDVQLRATGTDIDNMPRRGEPPQTAEQSFQTNEDDPIDDLSVLSEDISIGGCSDAVERPLKRRAPSSAATDDTDATSRTAAPSKRKKTARTEAERKAVLDNDPWTLSVGFTDVVCRGCNRSIKLDGRCRYYPGLWNKHRERCVGVQKGRKALAKRERLKNDPDAPSAPQLSKIIGGQCRLQDDEGSDAGLLEPRRSFSRLYSSSTLIVFISDMVGSAARASRKGLKIWPSLQKERLKNNSGGLSAPSS